MKRARSPGRTIANPDVSNWPTTAPCFSMKSVTSPSSPRPNCYERSKTAASNALGDSEAIDVDFRLISATNRPLDLFVRDGRFREDLYYRVNAFAIRLPSLRERQVDIPVLASRFLARYCANNGLPLDAKSFSPEATVTASSVSLARQHPRTGKHRLARGAVGARAGHSRDRHRVPARERGTDVLHAGEATDAARS